jgi:uncharacterized membrane protein YbhN (UPF0104 family)
MNISPKIRASLHWIGGGLSLLGLIFLGLRLQSYWFELDLSSVTPQDWLLLGLFSAIYGAANCFLALAWWQLLRHLGAPAVRLGSIKIYGISQLGKYAPGNIFHIAGRQALGMAAGIPAGILAKSSIWELCSIAIAGVLFLFLILPVLSPDASTIVGVLLFFGSISLVAGYLGSGVGWRPSYSFILQVLFLMVAGALFVAVLELIAGKDGFRSRDWPIICGAYTVAWLAGFLTPGAPAGVGVREMILLLLLKGLFAETDLLIAVLLGRCVTVAGDLLFFISTFLLPTKVYTSEGQCG